MMVKNKYTIPILIFLLAGLVILAPSLLQLNIEKETTLTEFLDTLNISMDINGEYKITEFIENKYQASQNNVKKIIVNHDNDIIKIRIASNLSEDDAKNYINFHKYQIENLFTEYRSPYPGHISDAIKCPEKYQPIKEQNGSDKVYYYLYANDRLTYGGCSEDLLEYLVALGLVHCIESKKILEIEFFTPKDNPNSDYKNVAKSLRC